MVGEYNVNYLLLDIIREYLTFNQVWKKIENGLGSEATRNSLSWDWMRRKQEDPKSYEEECRNRRIGLSKTLRQSSLRSVVEKAL